jgi:hypothetical protein
MIKVQAATVEIQETEISIPLLVLTILMILGELFGVKRNNLLF